MNSYDSWVGGIPASSSASHIPTIDRVKIHDFIEIWIDILD